MKSSTIIIAFLTILLLVAGCSHKASEKDETQVIIEEETPDGTMQEMSEPVTPQEEVDTSPPKAEEDTEIISLEEVRTTGDMLDLEPEDCLEGETYDPEEKSCFIECDNEECYGLSGDFENKEEDEEYKIIE